MTLVVRLQGSNLLPPGGQAASSLPRDTALHIEGIDANEGRWFRIHALPPLFEAKKRWQGVIPLTYDEVFALSQGCRSVWQAVVVEHSPSRATQPAGGEEERPFLLRATNPVDEPALKAIGARLALAGEKLFRNIFYASDEATATIGDRLCAASAEKEMVITVHSNEFCAPWGLIYTHPSKAERLRPDGANFQWEGFWAHRHIIEHNPDAYTLEDRLRPGTSGLVTSFNMDSNIDEASGIRCISEQLEFFRSLPQLQIIPRTTKQELQGAMELVPFGDAVLYFCCHGLGAGGGDEPTNLRDGVVALTDREPITIWDIRSWLGQRNLESEPLVFINTCQGGHMSTLLYRTVARELLQRRAMALIGAQVNVPVVFAPEYAKAFFASFLDRERPEPLGEVVRKLARDFLQKGNPLGFVYSLYRGVDCKVDWSQAPVG